VIEARIVDWAAWAPGLESREAWRQWAEAPGVPAADGAPAAQFLPALLRRRCTPLSRMMLTAAHDCLGDVDPRSVRPVFSSRHGSINESISMLEKVAADERISPTMFAHTVHNAQAALFSIATGNRCSSSALCAEDESFEAGYLEALLQLARDPSQPVLLVVGEVPLATGFAALIDEPTSAYALALLLERSEAAPNSSDDSPERRDVAIKVAFEMPPLDRAAAAPKPPWPAALEFLRWLLSSQPRLDLAGARHGWRWSRDVGAGGG